jgi:hypothetical protein
MRPLSHSLAVFMLSLTATTTGAQPPAKPPDSQEPIPRELALVLLNLGPGIGGAEILVGKAPDDIPRDLLPSGLQILGSTTQFETSVIILVAQEPPDSAVARYDAYLHSAGWTNPPVPQAARARGFVAAEFGQVTYDRPNAACRGEQFVTYSGSYRRNGGSFVRVTLNRDNRSSMCKARQDVTTYRSPYDEAPVPLLVAPFGSMTTQGGGMSASGNDSFSFSTRLSTRLSPGELVDHYNKQLRDQGWTSVTNGSIQFMAARTYRRNDDQGRAWIGTLMSIALPDSSQQQDVSFKLTRTQASRAK